MWKDMLVICNRIMSGYGFGFGNPAQIIKARLYSGSGPNRPRDSFLESLKSRRWLEIGCHYRGFGSEGLGFIGPVGLWGL